MPYLAYGEIVNEEQRSISTLITYSLFFDVVRHLIKMRMRIVTLSVAESYTEIHVTLTQGEFCVGYILAKDVSVASAVAVYNYAGTG